MRVAILCYQDCAFFELGCAVEMFALPRPEYQPWYQTDVVCLEAESLSMLAGMTLSVKHVTHLDHYDMLIIPSWPVNKTQVPENLASQVIAFHNAQKRIYAFCSGAFLLAQLSILDGFQATTHWRYAALFQQRFPKVKYLDDVLYVYQSNLGTSAGSAAALDLGIEIIRRDFGFSIANEVAKRLVLSAHRSGGQAQYVQAPIAKVPGNFTEVLDWAREHLAQPISVDELAKRAHMTRRSFDRKFRNTINLSANEWLIKQRLDLAKTLLETEALSIDQIAQQSGFTTAMSLRHHFRKSLGISPKRYREKFSSGHLFK